MFWHTPNGGKRSATEAAQFKAMGVVAGIPDLMLISAGRIYALEIKTSRGRASHEQHRMLDAMRAAGASVAVVHGVDAAIDQLTAWGVLRSSAAMHHAMIGVSPGCVGASD